MRFSKEPLSAKLDDTEALFRSGVTKPAVKNEMEACLSL